jgi:acetylornithine deacetylase/succinyl-diaminopimelate desuccinylase-like protein
VCGPGDLDQAHRVDEWVSVDALVDATVVYAHLLLSYGV